MMTMLSPKMNEQTLPPPIPSTQPDLPPYRRASRAYQREDTVITVNGVAIGSRQLAIIAGPCAVESRSQTFEVAAALAEMGVRIMRGGAYKPRTSPYAFKGLGTAGLE